MGQDNSEHNRSLRPPLFPVSDWFLYVIIALGLGAGIYLLPFLPEEIAPHFNASGEPTRYESKYFTIWFLPFLTAGLVFFMNLVLWAVVVLEYYNQNKARANFPKTRRLFFWIKFMLVLLMFGVYFYIIYWNLPNTNPDQLLLRYGLPLLLAGFLFLCGILMYRSEMSPNIPWWDEKPPPEVNRVINKRIGISFMGCGIFCGLTASLDGIMSTIGPISGLVFIPIAGTVWAISKGQKAWRQMKDDGDCTF